MPALEFTDLLAGLERELAVIEHGDAAAKLEHGNGARVGFNVSADFAEAVAVGDGGLVERAFDVGDALAVALDEDVFLVLEVVVEGRAW